MILGYRLKVSGVKKWFKCMLFGACVPFLDERRESMTLMHVAELLKKYLIQSILTVATGM